jgi:methylglutaconyl-CoA hydratase
VSSAVAQFNSELEKIRFDPSVRAVILCSSTPNMFCAGADLKERATMKEDEVCADQVKTAAREEVESRPPACR